MDSGAATPALAGTFAPLPTLQVSEPPTTVLFTDIVESTRIALEIGDDRWVELLHDHAAIVWAEVEKRDGLVVTSAGDGFVAIFPNPKAGIDTAVAVIGKSQALGLDVRAGLHCGTCKRCGPRVGGIVFHIAARVVDHSSGGEVLVTRALREAADDLELAFVERGACQLKGLPEAWELYALRHGAPRHGATAADTRQLRGVHGRNGKTGTSTGGQKPRLFVVGRHMA